MREHHVHLCNFVSMTVLQWSLGTLRHHCAASCPCQWQQVWHQSHACPTAQASPLGDTASKVEMEAFQLRQLHVLEQRALQGLMQQPQLAPRPLLDWARMLLPRTPAAQPAVAIRLADTRIALSNALSGPAAPSPAIQPRPLPTGTPTSRLGGAAVSAAHACQRGVSGGGSAGNATGALQDPRQRQWRRQAGGCGVAAALAAHDSRRDRAAPLGLGGHADTTGAATQRAVDQSEDEGSDSEEASDSHTISDSEVRLLVADLVRPAQHR